jgi:hydroxymethylbilane synthase
MKKQIKLGSRGSLLALTQANEAKEAILTALQKKGLWDVDVEIVPITTSGDRKSSGSLAPFGGKWLFTKEIEEALVQQDIDLAVHSMKDVETRVNPAFDIPCMLKREDARDVWIAAEGYSLSTIPPGSTIGTSSLRRAAQILHHRPDLKIVSFRGNVDTRLQKLQKKEVDATLLALAGLNRVGRAETATEILSPSLMTPAAGQGALGLQCLKQRDDLRDLVFSINHVDTHTCVSLERAFLEEIDGSCGTPVGAHATLFKEHLHFLACVATSDGRMLDRREITCSLSEADQQVRTLGGQMRNWMQKHSQ